MLKSSAALAAATRWFLTLSAGALLAAASPAKAEWNEPWKDEARALVIDAYEFNPIDWKQLVSDERIAGFISKASDGLPPDWSCRGLSGDDEKLCKNRWWKYSVTQELYFTRRQMAKSLGLEWGAYHLGRPGNPREQADHFIDFAKPEPDDLVALDIEDNDPKEWMSLKDAEIFAEQVKIRIGRYPVLYTNGSTAAYIAKNKDDYPLLSRLPLWYARYRDDITGMFPEDTWPSYALWQFSSMHNCNAKSCPYRVKGAKTDIDVNVSPLTVAELRRAWPFPELVGDDPAPGETPAGEALVAGLSDEAQAEVAAITAEGDNPNVANAEELEEAQSAMLAAYGPAESARRPLDPLELLTQAAREEHRNAPRQPILSALTDNGRKVDPKMPARGQGQALRSETLPTHSVAAGIVGAASQLKIEMEEVRRILVPEATSTPIAATPGPDETVELQDDRRAEVSEENIARSRIAAEMRRAMEKGDLLKRTSAPPAAPNLSSSLANETRGMRPRAALMERRIAEAFLATR